MARSRRSGTEEIARRPTATVSVLSGPDRGRTVRLTGGVFRIDADGAAEVVFATADESKREAHIATLYPFEETYELVVASGRDVWVNGERAGSRLLQTGDMVEIENGPVFRFRLYPVGGRISKSVAEVFSDCIDCSRRDRRGLLVKSPGLMGRMLRDLATQTSLKFRAAVLVALAVLAGAAAYQLRHAKDLEQRLALEQARVQGLHSLLQRAANQALTREELAAAREEIQRGLAHTEQRVAALEARSEAARKIIAELLPSIVFVQSGFGFQDPATGRTLRTAVGPSGKPFVLPGGTAAVTLTGDGPPVELVSAGTAFVVDQGGLLLTNRHVARPWENDASVKAIMQIGLRPVMHRMLAYDSGEAEPFEVALLGVSEEFDLAVLRYDGKARVRRPLALSAAPVDAGEPVIVLGYPTGVRALLARAGEKFLKRLGERADLDFWKLATELAQARLITPLATRGIVGQISEHAIVYDAETGEGGSGGPVVTLSGEVVAVNAAVVPEFRGSNLGVPVAHARALIEQLKNRAR